MRPGAVVSGPFGGQVPVTKRARQPARAERAEVGRHSGE